MNKQLTKFLEQKKNFESLSYVERKDIIKFELSKLLHELKLAPNKTIEHLKFSNENYLHRIVYYLIAEENLDKLKGAEILESVEKEFEVYKAKNSDNGTYSGMPLNYSVRLLRDSVKQLKFGRYDIRVINELTKTILDFIQEHPRLKGEKEISNKIRAIIKNTEEELEKEKNKTKMNNK